jgi:hypothetical protein
LDFFALSGAIFLKYYEKVGKRLIVGDFCDKIVLSEEKGTDHEKILFSCKYIAPRFFSGGG